MNWKNALVLFVALVTLGSNHLFARDLAEGEWYVRLVLESDNDGLVDSYNTLGQYTDALPGFDTYDLPELGQTWPGTYLSIIYYRPDWETDSKTYNSDYHPTTAKNVSDQWTFEVRSDDPARDLSLTWRGKKARLGRMVLVDLEENVVTRAKIDGEKQTYHFRMNGVVREFAWRLLTNKEYKNFVATGELPPLAEEVASPALMSADSSDPALLKSRMVKTTSNRQPSNWLPLGWGQGEGKGYQRQNIPAGLPEDPFGD